MRFYPTRNWDQLRGEERLQRPRAWHFVWGVIALLLLLLASAIGRALFAQKQRVATEERLAQNYWQSSRSAKAVGNDVEALHLAAEAIRLEPSLEVTVLLDVRDILIPLREMFKHNGEVRGAVFNHDESRILTWNYDGTARLWDVRTGQPLGPALQHQRSVYGAVFNRDGSRILTWSGDTVRIWPINVDFDFPTDAVQLWVEAITGSEYNFVAQQVKRLDSPRWHSIQQQYEKIASDHAKTCKYPEANQWLIQSNEKTEDWDQAHTH